MSEFEQHAGCNAPQQRVSWTWSLAKTELGFGSEGLRHLCVNRK